jgi:hypothetical protein
MPVCSPPLLCPLLFPVWPLLLLLLLLCLPLPCSPPPLCPHLRAWEQTARKRKKQHSLPLLWPFLFPVWPLVLLLLCPHLRAWEQTAWKRKKQHCLPLLWPFLFPVWPLVLLLLCPHLRARGQTGGSGRSITVCDFLSTV